MSCHKQRFLSGLVLLVLLISLLVLPQGSEAYAQLAKPLSRIYSCVVLGDRRCWDLGGALDTVVGPRGFPEGGPADGELVGGGLYPALDAQVPGWPATRCSPGPMEFKWYVSTVRASAQWRYFITREGWDSTSPLTRNALELDPFCSVEDGGRITDPVVVHRCYLPLRLGYHVVLGVWDLNETRPALSSYQAVDLDFGPFQ